MQNKNTVILSFLTSTMFKSASCLLNQRNDSIFCVIVTDGGDDCGVVTDDGDGCGVVTDGADSCCIVTYGCNGCCLVTDGIDGCGV